MTKQALLKAKIDLFNIVSNLSMQDYLQANYKNGKRISKKHKPYSLSADTEAAHEIQKMIFYISDADIITPEQEEQIKGFLLTYRTVRTEYLKENYKGGNWYYKNEIEELEQELKQII